MPSRLRLGMVVALSVAGGATATHALHVRAKALRAASAPTATATPVVSTAPLREELADIASLIKVLEPRLTAETDHLKIALLLRNFMHERIRYYRDTGPPKKPYDWFRLSETFKTSVLSRFYQLDQRIAGVIPSLR